MNQATTQIHRDETIRQLKEMLPYADTFYRNKPTAQLEAILLSARNKRKAPKAMHQEPHAKKQLLERIQNGVEMVLTDAGRWEEKQ